MQGLQRGVFTAVLMALWVTSVWGQQVQPDSYGFYEPALPKTVVIAERTDARISVYTPVGLSFRLREISAPGASFIKLHFSKFSLPEGIEVEISSADGSEMWRYAAQQRDAITVDPEMGDDGINSFSAMSITGDTVLVRVTGDRSLFDPERHLVEIDSWLEGFPLGNSKTIELDIGEGRDGANSQIENSCGSDERYSSVCWANSNPWEYEYSAAVAKLITSRGEVCTAWRVGTDNHMFTAEHCIGKQSELDGSEIWFNYESTSCGGSQTTSAVKVSGGSLLARDSSLDYTVFSVNNFSSISQFPSFGLDVGTAAVGEPIFIPQHGLGQPRQIALESDMNSSGECEVDAVDLDGYATNSDIGYYCDTATSSSGSPVVSNLSGKVIALHHFGGCMNAGVKMSRIWSDVSSVFNGQVPTGSSGGSGGGGGSDNDPLEANFSISCDGLSCSFNGSGSSGDIVSYNWDLGDGNHTTGASIEHDYSEADTYSVTLTVEDGDGESAGTTQSVTVVVPNEEPKASFSIQCVSNSCDFDASNSHDPDGSIESISWTLGDGATGYGSEVSHVYQEAGSYVVELTVTDDQETSDRSSKWVTISMPNEAPTASFVFSCTELECSFNATGSSDPDGDITAWNWDFGDGGSASGQLQNHNFGSAGTYSVNLSVTDNDGAVDAWTRSVQVSVTPPDPDPEPEPGPDPEPEPEPEPTSNVSPQAEFSYSCNDLDCTFNAEGSSDPDGELSAFNWNFGDGFSASGSQVDHRFDASGSYTVRLEVTDNEGASDSRNRTVSVEIQKSNSSPKASFSVECEELVCKFDAGASQDVGGAITSYGWSMGNGASMSGKTVEKDFVISGTYQVTLTVEDDSGETGSTSRTIEVEEHRPEIDLSGTGHKNNGRTMATLRWSGAETDEVELYRDGALIANTANDGKLIDTSIDDQAKSASYRLCQPTSGYCSDTLVLYFGSDAG